MVRIFGSNCEFCDDAGITHVANGEDDFDVVYCACPVGVKAEKEGVIKKLVVYGAWSEPVPVPLNKIYA